MEHVDLYKELNEYDEENYKDLIKILINNPYLDIDNAIFLKYQGFTGDKELEEIKDKAVLSDNSIKKYYVNYYDSSYSFIAKDYIKEVVKLDFKNISSKYFNITKNKVLINNDVDDRKANYFIIDNILYLSDLISERERTVNIIKSFAEYCILPDNNVFLIALIKSIINYYIDNKDIVLNKLLLKKGIPEIKYSTLEKAYNCFKKILKAFFNICIDLKDLIYILENGSSTEEIDNKYGKENIEKKLEDINNIEFPRLYIN